ncbi:DUF327 family protein [Sulfobacillus harzensis]|uniref:YaaR family protein n=1 Tax=Sulfobacillus harzensis TaxID=2729629 RepID=A0A7Y0L4B3_9FIRM|nr:DUF327 family protein [Sulfobacillus harzensis]NMP23084.1 YaaR family protein [Sulfobacillus harzensis]
MSIKLNVVADSSHTADVVSRTPASESSDRSASVRLLPAEEALWQQLSQSEGMVLDNPTDPHISQYLDTVRDLLNQALVRHQAKSSTYWSPKGRFRQMVHIVQINRALDDLLEDIRLRHPATQLARRLDAIRGLLLDLWM